jgi:Domain of unknown function (DUF222)/HNH endonuclease
MSEVTLSQVTTSEPQAAETVAAASEPEALDDDLAQRTTRELEDEVTALAARIAAATARFLRALGEFDARKGWAVEGIRSCAHWLSWRCGMALGTAREHVRVARSLRSLPQTSAALAAGDISFSKARAITRIATSETEPELLTVGRHGTAPQVESVVRGLRRAEKGDAPSAASEPRTYFRHRWDDDGTLYVQGRLSTVDGATFLAGLQSMLDRLDEDRAADEKQQAAGIGDPADDAGDPAGGSVPNGEDVPAGTSGDDAEDDNEDDDGGRRTSQLEAFVALAQAALQSDSRVGPTARRPDVVVHVDADILTADEDSTTELLSGRCRIDDGPGLTARVARQLACDGGLILHVHGPDGSSLAIGRRTRRPNAAIMRALWSRDGACIHPACGRRRFLHAHHVVHWAHGGPTDLSNLVLLCSRHHHDAHQGRIGVLWDGTGEPRVTGADAVIERAPLLPRPDPGKPLDLEDLIPDLSEVARASGERLNLHYTVGALLDVWQARAAHGKPADAA